MKLRHRLSLYSILIFSVITLIISVLIYFSYYYQMEKAERLGLESKSVLAAIYYLDKDELSSMEHEAVQRQLFKTLSRRNIVVYDAHDVRKAGDMADTEDISVEFLNSVRAAKHNYFKTDHFFYNGIFYEDNEGDFVVVTRAAKDEFNGQMSSLLQILVGSFLLGLVVIYLFSRYLGYIAYQPIMKIIDQINERNSTNFEKPIHLTRSYAEIQDLVNTYNIFVDRIAQTFNVQKNFIDYVSHELRTPITALLGTLEVTNQRDRTVEEYEAVMGQLKQYTNDLQETLEHMMLLSGAKTNFEFKSLRIDEIVWQVIENAILYYQANVNVMIEVENMNLLKWHGNDKLLALAFNNIIENAIKYSNNKPVKVQLKEDQGKLLAIISDEGIGISSQDMKNVKQNFFRGQNTQNYNGKGIGLSMANIIFNLHKIELDLQSDQHGTQVILTF
ncbi:sensor histidine kinase [Sphingobacterium lactis]|uniref:histidine kinase n=1 Tax=Sphingobacterium lactis TaxID=797291 RepID=A0A1H5U488_9SPHI|nr:ATP-binding protein [Sphingobacterium lactis]SEF69830.1 Signal transduction histidine kinase [Sphingobacterium lactis]